MFCSKCLILVRKKKSLLFSQKSQNITTPAWLSYSYAFPFSDLWTPSWCRRHRTRHKKAPAHQPIVFIVSLFFGPFALYWFTSAVSFTPSKSRSHSKYTLHKKYLLSLPSFVIGCKALAQFSLTVSFWSVGLWHNDIDSSPSSEGETGIASCKTSRVENIISYFIALLHSCAIRISTLKFAKF